MKNFFPETKVVPIDAIHKNPKNPRIIKDANFKALVKSIKEFPEMLFIRPIVVDSENMILGGNMRYEAAKAAGRIDVPILCADLLTDDQKREFIIKDNVSGGEWDWSELANEFDPSQLKEWGILDQDYEKIVPFGDTSTDRDKQNVSSTWDAVKQSENIKVSIGQLETSIPKDLAIEIISYCENSFNDNGTPIKNTMSNILENGIRNV